MTRNESFADDLDVHGGAVSSRVALLLRSAEANPARALICDFYNLPRLFWPQCEYCHGRYNGVFLQLFLPMYPVRVCNI